MPNYGQEANEIRANSHYEHIKILVWGPGNPGTGATPDRQRAYEKRLQIRDVLRTRFPRAEVYFSEDPEMIQITEGIPGQLRKEALQAKISDLVLMLDISRGADLELDHFVPTYPWFRDKVHVFVPERYMPPSGLVSEVFNYLRPEQIEGYSDADFEACVVATQKAVQVAEYVALGIRLSS